MSELSRYIPTKSRSEGISVQNYQGIAIDGESIAFAYIPGDGENIVSDPIMPLSSDSVQMVFEACRQSSRRALTATNLIEDFGHGSVVGRNLMQALSDSLVPYLDETENNKHCPCPGKQCGTTNPARHPPHRTYDPFPPAAP